MKKKKNKNGALYLSEIYKSLKLDPSTATLRAPLQHRGCQPCSLPGGSAPAAAPGGRAHRRPSRWPHTLPLPPAAPCRATMNLSGRAFVTESRCRLGSAVPLRPAVLQPLPARRCWSRFSELPVVPGGSPAFPRAPFLSLASTHFLRLFCNPCLLHSAGFLRPSWRVLSFFAVFCLAKWAGDFSTELSQCSLSSESPNTAQRTVHSLPAPQRELTPSHFHF